MAEQIRRLSAIQLCNLFGFNVIRHTKDRKKKGQFALMAVVWLMLIVLFLFYMLAMAVGLISLGMGDILPVYLAAITGIIIFVFTFLKAGEMLFQMHTYELLMALPVTKAAIIISRFLTMYVTNGLFAMLVMIPGLAVYVFYLRPGMTFYIFGFLGTLLLPLLPMSLASALGAAITALSAKMKRKSLVSALLTLFLSMGVLIGISLLGGNADTLEGDMDAAMLRQLTGLIEGAIGRIYPPARWLGRAVIDGGILDFLLFAGVSMGAFALLAVILQHYFLDICSALTATSAKNNYRMGRQKAGSVMAALWKKELKRYFASSIYVSNTMIGYILMVFIAGGLLFMGPEKIDTLLPGLNLTGPLMPMLLGMMVAMMPITSCSISMEGKQFWILQSLPVAARDIWNGKLLLNFTIALPFHALSAVLSILALKPSPLEIFWIIWIPFVYILFSAVAGLAINLAMPVFDWENETRVVKQSAASAFSMLAGMIAALVPIGLLFLMGKEWANLIYSGTTVVLLALTAVIYIRIGRVSLTDF